MDLLEKLKNVALDEVKETDMLVGIPFHEVKKDGIYRGMNNGCMIARKKILSYENNEEFTIAAENGENGFKLIVPKIPFKYWQMVWNFYRDVNEEKKAEAAVLFFWNYKKLNLTNEIPKEILEEYSDGLLLDNDSELILYVPKQENHVALTSYTNDKMRLWLKENTAILLDTHSHNTMSAFFSGTDDANETNFQFFSVFGKIGTENSCIMRYRFQGDWTHISVFDVFEEGDIIEGNKPYDVEYPSTWWNQASFLNLTLDTIENIEETEVEGITEEVIEELVNTDNKVEEEKGGPIEGDNG